VLRRPFQWRLGAGLNRAGRSKEIPSQIQIAPNPAKSSQAQAKKSKGINFVFLVRIQPFQELAPTPKAFFLVVR
jgi:hypothetical protein